MEPEDYSLLMIVFLVESLLMIKYMDKEHSVLSLKGSFMENGNKEVW
jgi:hypothetical protein